MGQISPSGAQVSAPETYNIKAMTGCGTSNQADNILQLKLVHLQL